MLIGPGGGRSGSSGGGLVGLKGVYYGHACIQITGGGRSLIVDPYLTGDFLALLAERDIRGKVLAPGEALDL